MKDQPPAFDAHAYDIIGEPKFAPGTEKVIHVETPVFSKGDRVRLTEAARRMFPRSKTNGTVTSARGVTGEGTIRVQLDGNKSAHSWSAAFWEREP